MSETNNHGCAAPDHGSVFSLSSGAAPWASYSFSCIRRPLGEWGAVILGMALVIGIPAVAGLLAKDRG